MLNDENMKNVGAYSVVPPFFRRLYMISARSKRHSAAARSGIQVHKGGWNVRGRSVSRYATTFYCWY